MLLANATTSLFPGLLQRLLSGRNVELAGRIGDVGDLRIGRFLVLCGGDRACKQQSGKRARQFRKFHRDPPWTCRATVGPHQLHAIGCGSGAEVHACIHSAAVTTA
jgi:hypothetical protein